VRCLLCIDRRVDLGLVCGIGRAGIASASTVWTRFVTQMGAAKFSEVLLETAPIAVGRTKTMALRALWNLP
jgi:hypothetical protein